MFPQRADEISFKSAERKKKTYFQVSGDAKKFYQLVQVETNVNFQNSTMHINNNSANINQTEENASNTGEKPVTIAIFVCLGIIGCLGNGFVLFIFCSSEKLRKSIVNIYLINQSAIDLLASLMLIVTAKGVTKSLIGLLTGFKVSFQFS